MHVVEVGCAGRMSLHEMVKDATRVQIIEPIEAHISNIRATYQAFPQVEIHPCAIWNENRLVRMYSLGETSFVEGIQSPVIANYGYQPDPQHEIWVEGKTFDQFDDGTIDILDIDTEGAEWYVLQRMISRPRSIIIETFWKGYRNPFMAEIEEWMSSNMYAEVAREGANSFYKRFGR